MLRNRETQGAGLIAGKYLGCLEASLRPPKRRRESVQTTRSPATFLSTFHFQRPNGSRLCYLAEKFRIVRTNHFQQLKKWGRTFSR